MAEHSDKPSKEHKVAGFHVLDPHSTWMEFHKCFYEYLKHLCTLSTGSVLLIAVFLEKIFSQPKWKLLVAVSVIGFLTAVVGSVLAYTLMVLHFPRPGMEPDEEWEVRIHERAILATWLGFLVGMVALTIFFLRNLF